MKLYGLVRGKLPGNWHKAVSEAYNNYVERSTGVVAAGGDAFTVCAASDVIGITMERQTGGTLHDRLYKCLNADPECEADPTVCKHKYYDRLGPSLVQRLKLLEGIAEGVCRLHYPPPSEATVAHGDIQSKNVLLSSAGDDALPRLSDFGLSRFRTVAGEERSKAEMTDAPLNGVWRYKAPEMDGIGVGLDGKKAKQSATTDGATQPTLRRCGCVPADLDTRMVASAPLKY